MEKSYLDLLNEWVLKQPAISTIIFAVVGGYALKIVEYLRVKSMEYSVKMVKSSAKKNAALLIDIYKDEYEIVKRMKDRDTSELYALLENLYGNVVLIFWFLGLYFGAKVFGNDVVFYSMLGSSSIPVIKIVLNVTHHEKLFRWANNFDAYSAKSQNKIEKMEKFLSDHPS